MKNQNSSGKHVIDRIEFLKKSVLFSELNEIEIDSVIKYIRPKKFKKNEIVFHQGDDSRSFFIILQGKVRIVRINEAGNETCIGVYSEHDIVGEFSSIDGAPRSATVQTLEKCTLLEIEFSNLLKIIEKIPKFTMGLIKILLDKLRWATTFAETIAQYDTAGRLLHFLLYYNDILGNEVVAGKRYELNLSMNQNDLASLVGSRREWVNRILKNWGKRGLIEYKNGKITIIDLVAVQKERNKRLDNSGPDGEW